MKAQTEQRFTPLELETRPTLDTTTAAYHLLNAPQTQRIWACKETGPLRPIRLPGSAKLHWPTAEIKRLLKVAPQSGVITLRYLACIAILSMLWLSALPSAFSSLYHARAQTEVLRQCMNFG